MTLRKKYKNKKYAGGGGMTGADPYAGLIQLGQQTQGALVDTVFKENEFGHQSAYGQALKGNSQLGTIGAVTGYIRGRKQEKEDKMARANGILSNQQSELRRTASILSTDPALVTGYQGAEYYASGGFLKNRYYRNVKAEGGTLDPMSSDSAEVQGPSHQQGGVELPQYGSELEGGETIQDDYVFSQRLGFAQQHKKLAKAIGKVEQKPATPERINSLKLMYRSVENLKQQQEAIRQQFNL